MPTLLTLTPSDFVETIQQILIHEPSKGQAIVKFINGFLPSNVDNTNPLIILTIIDNDGNLSGTVDQAIVQFNNHMSILNADR